MNDDDDGNFFRGLAWGLPAALLFWLALLEALGLL
jgi:hypothetical protein